MRPWLIGAAVKIGWLILIAVWLYLSVRFSGFLPDCDMRGCAP